MSSKKTINLLLVVFGFILIALTGLHTLSNPEIFTHIALGQAGSSATDPLAYTMTTAPWINMYPLYNKLVYGLWTLGGAGLITLVHVAVVIASFFLMFQFGKKWGGSVSVGLSLLLCTWLLLPVFNPGPESFFLLFTALFVTLLSRVKRFGKLAVALLILQVLWTNMHPSFLLGPLLILFFAIENRQKSSSISRSAMNTPVGTSLFILSAAALLVTLINPNIINLHRHLFTHWKVLSGTEGLEWISLFSNGFPQSFIKNLTVFSLILGAGGLITLQKKLPVILTMLAVLGAFFLVRSIGSLLSFSLLAFPFLILSCSAVGEYLTRTLTSVTKLSEPLLTKSLSLVALLLMIITAGSLITNEAFINIGSASHFGLGIQEDAFPAAAAELLQRNDFPERIVNIAHDGGYLAVCNPQHKIFCDTRTSFYGPDFYTQLNRAMLGQAAAWKTIISEWNPHAVILNGAWLDSGALANRLIASKAWKLVYFDGATIILVRDLPQYASLINAPDIQKKGLNILQAARETYKTGNQGLIKTGNSSRLIGAGGLYLALQRPAQAETEYQLLTQNSPHMATAWLGLGQSLILQKKITQGIAHMEKAASITPNNARVWLELLHAYHLKGDESNQHRAESKLNKFYKADQATVEQDAAIRKKKPAPARAAKQSMELPSELK